jgi:hypothetical protein
MGGIGPLQAAYTDEPELSTSVGDSQVSPPHAPRERPQHQQGANNNSLLGQHVFDSAAIFPSPYNEYHHMEPLIPSPHELSDMSLPLTGAEDGGAGFSSRRAPSPMMPDDSDGQGTEHAPRMSSSDEKDPSVRKSRRKEQNKAA